MADNVYTDGRLNVGHGAQVKAIHNKPEAPEKTKKITGSDLRDGKK